MEKSPHQEYRDDLADKLKDIRNSDRAKAEGYLEAKKETSEYKKTKEFHFEEREMNIYLGENFKKRKEFIAKITSELEKMKNDVSLGHIFKKCELIVKTTEHFIEKEDLYLEISKNPYYGISISSNFLSLKEQHDLIDNQDKIPEIFQNVIMYIGHLTIFKFNKEKKWHIVTYPPIISSLRFKEELQPIENTIEKVNKLRGVSFKWKSNEDSPREIGVIAEEVFEVFPELVFLDNKGKPLGVHYDKFVAVLIEAVKGLDKRIKKLEE